MGSQPAAILLIGPVGAGKTSYAQCRIARDPAVFFDLDSWMVRLFGDDPRPSGGVLDWYQERRERCRALIWDLSSNVLASGSDVVLEVGLLTAREREDFYERLRAQTDSLQILLVDAPRDVRRERVSRRNESGEAFVQIVPPEFFELASDAWEPPTEREIARWDIIEI